MASSTLPLPQPKGPQGADTENADVRIVEPGGSSGWLGLLPGILLLAVVGYAGKFIEQSIAHYGKAHHRVLPNIEYVFWAILIGVLISNTVGLPRDFSCGLWRLTNSG